MFHSIIDLLLCNMHAHINLFSSHYVRIFCILKFIKQICPSHFLIGMVCCFSRSTRSASGLASASKLIHAFTRIPKVCHEDRIWKNFRWVVPWQPLCWKRRIYPKEERTWGKEGRIPDIKCSRRWNRRVCGKLSSKIKLRKLFYFSWPFT